MKKSLLRNSFISESGKKTENKKDAKTSSTNIDSNSQKYDSNSNSKKISHLSVSIKTIKSPKVHK